MRREQYFDKCISAAIKSGKYGRISDTPWEEEDLVVYDGGRFVPSGYVLTFDRKGVAVHSCELHDVRADSVLRVRLDKVED